MSGDVREQIFALLDELRDAGKRAGHPTFVNRIDISWAIASHFDLDHSVAVGHFLDWRDGDSNEHS